MLDFVSGIGWRKPRVVEYKLVELFEPRTQSGGDDKETRESIATLAHHPGFLALMAKLSTVRQLLKTKVSYERHEDIRAVDFLQAGIFWSNWLATEVNKATTKLSQRTIDPSDDELAAFREIDQMIERVGQ